MDEWFSEPEPNVIQDSAGFSINVLGRTGLGYTEGGRSFWIAWAQDQVADRRDAPGASSCSTPADLQDA